MLTEEQQQKRQGKITGSRIGVLMKADPAAIYRLWQEMRGEVEPEDLSNIWAVALGGCTEQLQLDWFEQKNKLIVSGRGAFIQSSKYDFAGVTLDGWVESLGMAIECKHVGGREPIEIIVDRYFAQCSWIMLCTESTQCALSIILGANEPVIEYVDRSDDYLKEAVSRAEQFMRFVLSGEPPVALEPVAMPIDPTRVVDMSSNNHWVFNATEWLDTREAARRNADAAMILKDLVAEDVKQAYGHGVRITRDRAGRLSLREYKE
jgi:hypothetical protein